MLERDYQKSVITRLKKIFPGCVILKNDATYKQGIPDLLVLFRDRWATLEVKASEKAGHRPNQDYNVKKMNEMSYSAFIYPENEEKIFSELEEVLNK